MTYGVGVSRAGVGRVHGVDPIGLAYRAQPDWGVGALRFDSICRFARDAKSTPHLVRRRHKSVVPLSIILSRPPLLGMLATPWRRPRPTVWSCLNGVHNLFAVWVLLLFLQGVLILLSAAASSAVVAGSAEASDGLLVCVCHAVRGRIGYRAGETNPQLCGISATSVR